MHTQIHYINQGSAGNKQVNINPIPDTCPHCHVAIEPHALYGYCFTEHWNRPDAIQIVFACTSNACRRLFFGYYNSPNHNCDTGGLTSCAPIRAKPATFAPSIKAISQVFCDIFKEANEAEKSNLLLVCGPGYRKALEFLIKDYLIGKINSNAALTPEEKTAKSETIKKKQLGPCIKDHLDNATIKMVAERATWLGNDETHYVKKWEDKDLSDLKDLIALCCHWMEMEELTTHFASTMPGPVTQPA